MMTRILDIWTAGGWVMWPLLVVSLLVFGVGLRLWLDLQRRQFRRLTDTEWQGWVHRPEAGQGEVGELTLIGEGGAGTGSDAMDTRSDYYGSIHNSIFTQFQGCDQVSSVPSYNGSVTHNLFWENAGGIGSVDEANNTFANPLLRQIDRGQNEALDPRPQAGSPAFEGSKPSPTDGYFIAAPYKGAFTNALWCQDWTALTDNGHLRPVAHALVCDPPASAAGEGPTLSARLTENEFVLSFPSVSGTKYQIQSRAAVGPGDWTNEGAPLDATGEVLTFREATGNAQKFYRILVP